MSKQSLIFFLLIFSVLYHCACSDKDIANNLNGSLKSHSACKKNTEVFSSNEIISKIVYEFNKETNILSLNHINVPFNCCPDSLGTEFSFVKDTFLIKEYEVNGNCRCTCFYDLDMIITGVEEKKYTIQITEPYQIFFDIDLEYNPKGSFIHTIE